MVNMNRLRYFCVVLPDLLVFIFTGLQHSCWGKRCAVIWWAETEDCHCSCFGTKTSYFASWWSYISPWYIEWVQSPKGLGKGERLLHFISVGVTMEGTFNINQLKRSSSMILTFKIIYYLTIATVFDTRDLKMKHTNIVADSPASYFEHYGFKSWPKSQFYQLKQRNIHLNYSSWYLHAVKYCFQFYNFNGDCLLY